MRKFYERYIQGGKNLTILATLFFIGIRLFFIFKDEITLPLFNGGLLWNKLQYLISSADISILAAGISGALIAILLAWINNKYAIIRRRTTLHVAVVLLLLSINPALLFLSPHYIAAIFLLLAFNPLFASYQERVAQRRGIDVGIYLTFSSLFVTEYLIFIPLFLIGFIMMRSFSFKVLLSTIIPVCLIYTLAYGYFIYTGEQTAFLDQFNFEALDNIRIVSDNNPQNYLVAALGLIFLIVLMVDNRMNNYKDKIRVRECVAFFCLLLTFSFLTYFLSPILTLSEAMIIPSFIMSAFVLARFWETAKRNWKIFSFFLLIVVYSFFISKNIVEYFS